MPSPSASMTIVPPQIVMVPADSVSSSSGDDLIPSFPASMSSVPPLTITSPSAARPLLAARTAISPPLTVTVDRAAPLMPFLQALPSAVRDPGPLIVRDAADFTLMAAPSKSLSVSSVSGSSRSVRTELPTSQRAVRELPLHTRGALVEQDRVRSSITSRTPVTLPFTTMPPSAHDPVTP